MKQYLVEWMYHPNLDLSTLINRLLDANFHIDHIVHTHYDENMVAICTLIIVSSSASHMVGNELMKIKQP